MDEDTSELIRGLAKNEMSWSAVQALYQSAAQADTLPDYTTKWNLATDPKLDEGVIYMATSKPERTGVLGYAGDCSEKTPVDSSGEGGF